jgi:phage/plasmid-associated DNA primase
LQNGFTIPASSQQANDKRKLETKQVAQFVMDTCDVSPAAVKNFGQLYKRYQWWVNGNQLTQTLTPKLFSTRLQKLVYKNSHSGDVHRFLRFRLEQ